MEMDIFGRALFFEGMFFAVFILALGGLGGCLVYNFLKFKEVEDDSGRNH